MKYIGIPMGMWLLFKKSFRRNMESEFGVNAADVTRKAKRKYKEIIASLPEFEKTDRFQINIVNCAMLGAFVLSMPFRPDVEALTEYYAKAMMTPLMKWFCRESGKGKYMEKDIDEMKLTATMKFADRNPYSWNMDFYEYPDGSGYETRFTKCGICVLMKEFRFLEQIGISFHYSSCDHIILRHLLASYTLLQFRCCIRSEPLQGQSLICH